MAPAKQTRYGPFPIRTQNPLYLLFLGMRPDRPATLEKGALEFRIDSSYSNLFEQRSSSVTGNALDLDMELWRVSYQVRYGVTDRLDVGLEIPTLHMKGGFLDPLVQGYHDLFGFPNAGREFVANDQYTYRVAYQGATIYEVGKQTLGLSDAVVDAKVRLLSEGEWAPAIAVQAAFKAPTGRRAAGLGSGTPDGGIFWLAEKGWRRLTGYINAGPLFLGGAAPLGPISRSISFAWMTGLEVNLLSWISAIAQVGGSTPFFQSTGFSHLDDAPLDLAIGFRGGYRQWFFQAAFVEDPGANDPSVDFTGFLSLGYRLRSLKGL